MRRRRVRRKTADKRKIKSKGVVIDGIKFKSKLEGYMYQALKDEGISCEYEAITFTLQEGFFFPNKSYERQANNKGDMVDRGGKKILPIKYTPDFTGDGFIIESKGFPNDDFRNKWKMFKKYIAENRPHVWLFKPQKKSECIEVAKIIKKMQNGRR